MKQNLGKLDRIFRFVLGIWLLSPLAPAFGIVWLNWALLVLGIIALIESFIGSCWLHTLFGINNKNQ